MKKRATTPMALGDLRACLHGDVILPDDDGYDCARRVWNGMIESAPAMIIRSATHADVVRAIEFARIHSLPVAVRGGGHSVCGQSTCHGGIVIDLSQMKGIHVDPLTCTVRAEAGLTLGEFVREIEPFGLLTTTGTVAGTGLSGLTLGGGLGWFMGKYGLTIDNLLSADVVTADGRTLTASQTSHADLFWGLRGGGGNFGIVTAFVFQLHRVSQVLSGKVVYPMSKAREVLRFYREYTSCLPDELTAYASVLTTSDGEPAISITLCFCGEQPLGERLIEPVRKFGSPLLDLIRPRSYLKLITQANAGAPEGRCYYQQAKTLKELSDEAIEILAEAGTACTSPYSQILIQHVHGAASRVPPTETAFALRGESYVISVLGAWNGGEAQQHLGWVRACCRALSPYAASGVYINFLGTEGEEQVRAAYGLNYERLVALKNRYDPSNFFSLNQNIRPKVSQPHSLSQALGVLAA